MESAYRERTLSCGACCRSATSSMSCWTICATSCSKVVSDCQPSLILALEAPDLWGDVNDSGAATLEDVFLMVDGFVNPVGNLYTVEQMDVDPACDGGNGVVNLGDAQRGVLIFQGQVWLDACAAPCGP